MAHPVLQASYCHYSFVVIHPFEDGNGRVARALASTFFYRGQSIPLVIFGHQRSAYLDALALADQRNHGEIIEFFRDRGIDTMQLVRESMMTAVAPKPEDQTSRINKTAKIWRDLSLSDLKAISDRISRELRKMFEEKFAALKSQNLSISAKNLSSGWRVYPSTLDYKRAPSGIHLYLASQGRRDILELKIFMFWSLRYKPFPLLIRAKGSEDLLEARLEDVTSELTPYFLLRLDQWVQRQLGRMLAEIAERDNP